MLKELSIIEAIGSVLPNKQVLGDDTYVEESTGRIYTTDILVEHRHFSLDYFSPQDLGWKAAAVNISDIAATGGEPLFLLIALGLPPFVDEAFIRSLYKGIHSLSSPFQCAIIGGDTVGSTDLTLSITAIGQLPKDHTAGRRNQAKPGDLIVTTGYAGLSAAGLFALQQKLPGYQALKEAHLRPVPMVKEGLMLSKSLTRYALMDSSDGLADALLKIAQSSQVQLQIKKSSLPLHPELLDYCQTTGQNPWSLCLYGGEDFQLVATVPTLTEELQQHFHVIGQVVAGPPGACLSDDEGTTIETLSLEKTYQHFEGEQRA